MCLSFLTLPPHPPKAIMVGFPPISQSKLDGNLTGDISLLPCSFWQLGCFSPSPKSPAVPAPSRIRDPTQSASRLDSLEEEETGQASKPGGQVGEQLPQVHSCEIFPAAKTSMILLTRAASAGRAPKIKARLLLMGLLLRYNGLHALSGAKQHKVDLGLRPP